MRYLPYCIAHDSWTSPLFTRFTYGNFIAPGSFRVSRLIIPIPHLNLISCLRLSSLPKLHIIITPISLTRLIIILTHPFCSTVVIFSILALYRFLTCVCSLFPISRYSFSGHLFICHSPLGIIDVVASPSSRVSPLGATLRSMASRPDRTVTIPIRYKILTVNRRSGM